MYNNNKKVKIFSSDDIFLFKLIGGCVIVVVICLISML